MVTIDLHLHTTASDGRLTPAQLIELLARRGLRVVAITDHDTTNGLADALEAATAHPDLTVIPGIELSADVPGTEIHVLGYFIDYHDGGFQRTLESFRSGREERARLMVEKLAQMGVHIPWQRVRELADGAVGRPHIAQAMVERGYIASPKEAFERYIGRNGPAYVERSKLTPEEAARLIRGVGGLPVLAHPTYVEEPERFITPLKAAGLVGMEVYYGDYSPETVAWLEEVARREGLIPCGGSDYHALGTPGEPQPGQVGPPMDSVERLMALAREQERPVS